MLLEPNVYAGDMESMSTIRKYAQNVLLLVFCKAYSTLGVLPGRGEALFKLLDGKARHDYGLQAMDAALEDAEIGSGSSGKGPTGGGEMDSSADEASADEDDEHGADGEADHRHHQIDPRRYHPVLLSMETTLPSDLSLCFHAGASETLIKIKIIRKRRRRLRMGMMSLALWQPLPSPTLASP